MTTTLGVLIVDDNPALLQALPRALRQRMGGVTVETADSAAAALERIVQQLERAPRAPGRAES